MNSTDPSMSGFRSPTGVVIANLEENSKISGIGAFGPLSSSDATILSGDVGKSNSDDFIGLNYFNYPLDSGSNIRTQKTVTYIQALADMLVCPNTNFPISVGLFSRVGAGIRTTHLEKLSEELNNLTKLNSQRILHPSWLLFLFPVFIFVVIGIMIGVGTHWIVGVSMGATLSLLSFLTIEIIIFGSKRKRWVKAVKLSQWLANFTESLQLFLDILFCYPQDKDSTNKPLSVLITHHNLSNYSTASHMTLSIVEKIWKAVEKKYSCLLTRLQHSCKDPESNKRYKNICCIPIFVLVIIFFVAIITNSTLFTIYNAKPMDIFINKAILPIFVIMSCVVFLSIFGTLPLLCRTVTFLIRSPSHQLKQMVESCNIDFQASDTLVKNEMIKLCQLISIFEAYLDAENVRLFVLIDAAETDSREKLANAIYLLNGLIQITSSAPIAIILAADFQTLMTEWSHTTINPLSNTKSSIFQELSDNFHLIHSTIHLPIYMEEGFDFSRSNSGKKKLASNGMFCIRGGNSFESLNMVSTANKPNSVPVSGRKTSIYQSVLTFDPTGKGASKSVQQLFLARGDLTEINNKMIKQLSAAAAFVGRLLRINLIEFKVEHLVAWLSISVNWPYYSSLLTLFLEEQYSNLTLKHNLLHLYEQVQSKTGGKDQLPAEIEFLARDDRDFSKLDAFIRKETGTVLTVSVLKYFISWSPFMNPYFRYTLRDYLTSRNIAQTRGSRNQVISPPQTSIALSEQSDNIHDEDLPQPIVSPINGSVLANQVTSWSKASFANLANKADRPKTPIAIKRCMVKLKDGYPGKDLSQLDKYEIGVLMSQVEGLSSDINIEKYKEKLIYLNVTGLVLSVCDMEQLQSEMEMTFGDWQLFKTLINHLRAVEAFKSDDMSNAGDIYGEQNQMWVDNDIDGESDEDDRFSQTCWSGYSRNCKPSSKRVKGVTSKMKHQTNSSKSISKKYDNNKYKPATQPSKNGNSLRKTSLNYSKTGYIYSPLATDENVITNSYPIEPEKIPYRSFSHVPHAPQTSQPSTSKNTHSSGGKDNPIFPGKNFTKSKNGSNISLSAHLPSQQDKVSDHSLRKKDKSQFLSLSQSQERIHLVRARNCPSSNTDHCATYIPVLLQTSLGGCGEIGDQECTCDYWFRIEQNGLCHKISTSEPASRSQSRPQTSPEGSEEEDNPRNNAFWPESVTKRPFNGSAV